MGEVQWIKLYLDIFDTNQKIKKLRRLPAGSDIVLIWIMLLVKAGRCNAGGHIFITENIPYTVEDLADEFKFDVNTIKLALNAFGELDMIAVDDEGFIFITGWEKYQSVDKLAELRAKDRERKRIKRAEAKALLENSTVVHGQSADSPHIEEEKEEEKEKEFHSFVLSREELDIIDKRIKEQGFEGEDAIAYGKKVSKELRLTTMHGTLGQGKLMMSEEQFNDLLSRLSWEEFHKYIGIVVECEKKGKRYKKKSHYEAILEMVAADRRIKK